MKIKYTKREGEREDCGDVEEEVYEFTEKGFLLLLTRARKFSKNIEQRKMITAIYLISLTSTRFGLICQVKSSQDKVTLLLIVGQSVSLGVEPHLGLMTRYLLLFYSYGLVFVGRPL
jgi:hypothetical protein